MSVWLENNMGIFEDRKRYPEGKALLLNWGWSSLVDCLTRNDIKFIKDRKESITELWKYIYSLITLWLLVIEEFSRIFFFL